MKEKKGQGREQRRVERTRVEKGAVGVMETGRENGGSKRRNRYDYHRRISSHELNCSRGAVSCCYGLLA